ncbi:MAG: PaaI family thioesterase [Intestinimonas sp.]|jgi:acyl-CoA thioesterase|nr:PaaI family thioesterase [Intestinimonas sp.]
MAFCSNAANIRGSEYEINDSIDPFSKMNGITVTNVKDGVGYGELSITPGNLNPMGMVHGGCLAALADTVAGGAVITTTGHVCVTASYSMNFLRPAMGTGKKIHCQATPRKMGRNLCVYAVSLTNDSGEEVAGGDFTFFLLQPAEGQIRARAKTLWSQSQHID